MDEGNTIGDGGESGNPTADRTESQVQQAHSPRIADNKENESPANAVAESGKDARAAPGTEAQMVRNVAFKDGKPAAHTTDRPETSIRIDDTAKPNRQSSTLYIPGPRAREQGNCSLGLFLIHSSRMI